MSLKFAVGDLTIHRIIEQETTFLPALEVLPGLTPELLAEHRSWMREAGALDESDVLILCFQSYVVRKAATVSSTSHPPWLRSSSAKAGGRGGS